MNKTLLIGRTTKDPDIRYTQSEQPMTIARFNLAVDRRFKKEGEQSADFISCVAFGKTAEFIEKYVFKGTKIAVEGRIQTGNYTNKDGVKVYTTDVVAENVEFAESKATAANYSNGGFEGAANEKPAGAPGDGFMNVADGLEDEGLPF